MRNKSIYTITFLLIAIFGISLSIFGQDNKFKKRIPITVDTSALRTGGHFLSWSAVQTTPTGFVDCLAMGEITLRGFQNFRRSTSEVTGVYGMNYASITCVNNTAYVMVVGSEKNKTNEIQSVLVNRFQNSNVALPTVSQVQAANSLYFSTTSTKVSKLENCLSISRNAIRNLFPNFTKLSNGATAWSSELSAGIACQQTGSRMSAIIIVSGKDSKKVQETRAFLHKRMATTVLIDEGTELNPVDGDR